MKIQTILYATDFSECSQKALQIAFSLARDYKARLVVLHVAIRPPFITYGEFEKALQETGGYRQQLENMLRECQLPECNAEFRLEEGDPATEILNVAAAIPCDLIIMGMHGRTGLKRLLMGSVSEKVVRQAGCPVMTVSAPCVKGETTSERPVEESAGR
jgi:nucleotide-binding universal stress UspA family protein